jgi:hypothetical protein
VVKAAVVDELAKRGVPHPMACAEPAEPVEAGAEAGAETGAEALWAADFNPGVVSLTAEMLGALA